MLFSEKFYGIYQGLNKAKKGNFVRSNSKMD
jgi:hypothetical protein